MKGPCVAAVLHGGGLLDGAVPASGVATGIVASASGVVRGADFKMTAAAYLFDIKPKARYGFGSQGIQMDYAVFEVSLLVLAFHHRRYHQL